MNLHDIKTKLSSEEYDFLRTNEHLGDNIILLGLGGSYAYGMEQNDSDVDIRGAALNSKSDILGLTNGFEQVIDNTTDTTIYSFNKLIKLLEGSNPNIIEILSLKPEHYLYLSPIGQELLDNKKMFLSQRASFTFGGYAGSQLRRLNHKAARTVGQAEQEQQVLKSINNASVDFRSKFFEYEDDDIKLYIDDAINKDLDKEIFMDISLHKYPLRDYKSIWSTMNTIVKDYAKIGHRNKEAISYNKLSKHMAHLVRLYYMCFDILERGEVVTYRAAEHDLLMSIRNGDYLDNNNQPIPEFFDMVDELEKRMDYAKNNTCIPEKPDYNAIKEFTISVNERVVKEEI